MLLAVDHWMQHGRQLAVAESARLDDAFNQFKSWLDKSELRKLSRHNLRCRVNIFVNSVPNVRLSEITHETVEAYLDGRKVSAKTRDNDRRALSRFFSWSIERPRRWLAINPCREIRIPQAEHGAPVILSVDDCKMLLTKAQTHKGGQLVPYLAVSLFGGLRPFESTRLDWRAVNLADGEIRLEGSETKTGKPRVVAILRSTLKAWISQGIRGQAVLSVKLAARFYHAGKATIGVRQADVEKKPDLKPWTVDILRHAAISHYFRKTGSYGQTAEQFGNSEAIIKNHYQGRVSTADTAKFYALKPAKKGGAK